MENWRAYPPSQTSSWAIETIIRQLQKKKATSQTLVLGISLIDGLQRHGAREEECERPESVAMLILQNPRGQEMALTQEGNSVFQMAFIALKAHVFHFLNLSFSQFHNGRRPRNPPIVLTVLSSVWLSFMPYLGHGKAPTFIVWRHRNYWVITGLCSTL